MQNLRLNLSKKKFKFLSILFFLAIAYLLGELDMQNLLFNKLNREFSSINRYFNSEKVNSDNYLGVYIVNYVVDGDTFHVKNMEGKEDIVRLLAVNTLEKNSSSTKEKCLANLQTLFTKDYLLNKEVYLYTDESQPMRDKYNRILAYVSTSTRNDNYFFNDVLIETGNAIIYRANPVARKYYEYQQKMFVAQEEKLGMWAENLECQ